jgi:nitrate reductase NapE component
MFPPVPSRLSDEEYIEKIRKSVLFWDRFRCWATPVLLVILAAFLWFCVWVVQILAGPGPAGVPQGMWQGFSFGAVTGLFLAFMFGKITHGFITLRPGLRTERLLLEYHDHLLGTTRPGDDTQASDRDVRRHDSSEILE